MNCAFLENTNLEKFAVKHFPIVGAPINGR